MTLNDVLLALLEALETTGKTHIVRRDSIQQWPHNALGKLLETGILAPTKPAESVECCGCENHCYMDVNRLFGGDKRPTRAFVVCNDPEMQEQMGRIEILPEQLQQWKVTATQLAELTAGLLGIECKAEDRHGQTDIRVGMIKCKNNRRWISLNKSPLTLQIGDYHVPLGELLFFENGALTIDRGRIEQLIDKTPISGVKEYKPSTRKREARKRKTEAMYEDWHEEYLKLRHEYPDTARHSDSWIAKQIAKLDIAQGRDSETIRKHMKK